MFYLSVRSKGSIIFECYSRRSGLSLDDAWMAALPAILECVREPGANHLILRINDAPVLDG